MNIAVRFVRSTESLIVFGRNINLTGNKLQSAQSALPLMQRERTAMSAHSIVIRIGSLAERGSEHSFIVKVELNGECFVSAVSEVYCNGYYITD